MSSFSGLPDQFVKAMKKLFDILDKDHKGWIYLEGENNLLCWHHRTGGLDFNLN